MEAELFNNSSPGCVLKLEILVFEYNFLIWHLTVGGLRVGPIPSAGAYGTLSLFSSSVMKPNKKGIIVENFFYINKI